MRFEWTDDLNTGIPEIDAQNRRIEEYINTLYAAKEMDHRETVGQVLDQMLDFAVNHFLFEEHLLEQANFEFRASHERIHEIFAKKLADFRGRYAQGENPVDEVLAMLTGWVGTHIRREDKTYVAAVQQVIDQQGGRGWVAGVMKKLFG